MTDKRQRSLSALCYVTLPFAAQDSHEMGEFNWKMSLCLYLTPGSASLAFLLLPFVLPSLLPLPVVHLFPWSSLCHCYQPAGCCWLPVKLAQGSIPLWCNPASPCTLTFTLLLLLFPSISNLPVSGPTYFYLLPFPIFLVLPVLCLHCQQSDRRLHVSLAVTWMAKWTYGDVSEGGSSGCGIFLW